MQRNHNADWISASEIAEFVYCPAAFRLKRAGVRPHANRASRDFGSKYHRAIGTRVRRVERACRVIVGLLMAAIGVAALLVCYLLRS